MDTKTIMAGTALLVSLGTAGKVVFGEGAETKQIKWEAASVAEADAAVAEAQNVTPEATEQVFEYSWVNGERHWLLQTPNGPAFLSKSDVELTKLAAGTGKSIVRVVREIIDENGKSNTRDLLYEGELKDLPSAPLLQKIDEIKEVDLEK